jgi:hypothetical protein
LRQLEMWSKFNKFNCFTFDPFALETDLNNSIEDQYFSFVDWS